MTASDADRAAVAALLGREPEADFDVAVRGADGGPVVIRNGPFLADGTPMPTRYWLVGERERVAVARLETVGGVREVEAELGLAVVAEAHDRYAAEREAAIPDDHAGPRPSGGVGGTRTGVKCLHAHYAWWLAGGDDPVGRWAARRLAAATAEHHRWDDPAYVADWVARDDARRAERDEQLGRLVAPLGLGPGGRVLDLGAGHGVVSAAVRARYPDVHVTLVDGSAEMLAVARTRLGAAGAATVNAAAVEAVVADLADPGWVDVVGRGWDAVVTSLALHNLRDPAVRERLYRTDVPGLLAPGGTFAEVDLDGGVPADTRAAWLRAAGLEAEVRWRGPRHTLLTATHPR